MDTGRKSRTMKGFSPTAGAEFPAGQPHEVLSLSLRRPAAFSQTMVFGKMEAMTDRADSLRIEDLLPYREEVFLLCLGFSRNAAVAEDLCQDVYLRAFRKLDSVRSPEAVRFWLFRLAKNICRDHYRRSRLVGFDPLDSRADLAAASNGGEPDDFEDRLVCLKSSVETLPRKLREVFILRTYARLSYEDVARTLRIKEGTVMSRLHRARAAVARSMSEVRHE